MTHTEPLIAPANLRGQFKANKGPIAERRAWIKAQHAKGHSFSQIGRALGIDSSTAHAIARTDKPAPAPAPPVASCATPRHDRRYVLSNGYGQAEKSGSSVARVSLPRAPWEPVESRPDPRPETHLRFPLIGTAAGQRAVGNPVIAALRAELARHRGGVA